MNQPGHLLEAPPIILPNLALVGKMGSGKDTAAELLVTHFPYHRFACADPFKVMLGPDCTRADQISFAAKVRALAPDAWINLLLKRIEDYHYGARFETPRFAVISDVRMVNEVGRLVEAGYRTVRLTASRNVRLARLQAKGRIQDEAQLLDPTETALDRYPCNYEIDNEHNDRPALLKALLAILNKERR